MKTEKRKAKVGERILITNAKPAMGFGQYYSNGDILHVTETDIYGEGNVGVDEFRGYIREDEYEVIVDENETEADNVENVNFSGMSLAELEEFVQKAVKALSKRAFHAGFRDGIEAQRKLDGKRDERKKSLQQRRDAIIEKAKREVEEIRNDPIQMEGLLATFIVDREKRMVTALLSSVLTGVVERQGVAKCHPDDCFNIHLGKIIALYRAQEIKVPNEYLNAPQPTEVRVGDIVEYVNPRGDKQLCEAVDRFVLPDEPYIHYESIGAKESKIIDDSREGCVVR